MARKSKYSRKSKYIEITGGVFDDGSGARLVDAINEGLAETGEEAAGVLVGFISVAGFVDSGSFMRSVDSALKTRGGWEPGFIKVAAMDAWPEHGRPTRTWGETGMRGGKKLRRGGGMFSKTQRRVGDFSFANIEAAIERALD